VRYEGRSEIVEQDDSRLLFREAESSVHGGLESHSFPVVGKVRTDLFASSTGNVRK